MRLIVVLIASLIASAASAADGWREYIYLGLTFAVSFPAPPKIEEVDYPDVGGTAVKARVYLLECREMSFVAADGSHSTVASVYYQRKLYQIQNRSSAERRSRVWRHDPVST